MIEEDCYNEFSKIINQSNHKKTQEEIDNELQQFISRKKPEIFNDIESAINCLNNSSKLNLISINLINLAYKNTINLKNINCINYYAGNNKLII